MDERELKDKLQKLDVPPPSDGEKERAINLAKQAFIENEKKRQGSGMGARLISTNNLIRSLTMKKAYVFAGTFTALALVIAVSTNHYSTIMQSTGAGAPAEAVPVAPVQTTQTELQEELKAKTDQVDISQAGSDAYRAAMRGDESGLRTPQANMAAPGMNPAAPVASMASSPPPSMQDAKKESLRARGMMKQMAQRPERAAMNEAVAGAAVGMTPPLSRMAPGVAMDMIAPYPYPQPPVYQSGDKFDSFASNPTKQVSQEPVSTFSLDVDTASYSVVRNMLKQGQLPQRDAVRTEEMINYFQYDYALPTSKSEPFKPSVTVYPTPWNTNTKLVHIGIKTLAPEQHQRANLVFLIDVSGSMNQPNKLPWVKASLKMLVDQMDANDTIGIVTYAGYSGVALEPSSNKQQINAVIDQLGAGGGTAGAAGIQEAYQLAAKHFNKNATNRVILATDGDFNVGISDQTQLKTFIEEKRNTGVFLSILGFGEGNYNDALMQTLAQAGNGNAAYIDNLNEARKVLVDEATSTLFTVAKDVKIQVEFNPALVSEYRLIGYESRQLKREDFNNDKIDAGDVGAGKTVTAIYEITPANGQPQAIDELRYRKNEFGLTDKKSQYLPNEYGFLKMRYKLPNESESKLITQPISVKSPYDCPADALCRISALPEDVQFATAVAAFGQMLRGDIYPSNLPYNRISKPGEQDAQFVKFRYDDIIALAKGAKGKDTFGYRAEFIGMVEQAKALSQGNQPMPLPGHIPGCDNGVCE